MTTTPVITTESLSKTFSHSGTQQHVLRNVGLDIEKGSFTVIMGPSGAGKSTLMYALSGLDTPTLGQVRLAGTVISNLSEDRRAKFRRRHCGFVFQQIHLLDSLSVIDNLMAVGLLVTRNRKALRARCAELLDLVGVEESTWGKFPAMLSGGEAQRVGIARALVNSPAVVFADEPTGQLNSEYSGMVLDLLGRVNAGGQTIVMVTHDLRSAARGSRILYLRDGKVRGELDLGPRAGAAEDDERTTSLSVFLTEMGW
ncbi:ABC transporter ATP-binding protein [Schaalia sp. 19OD2882]|uniref:ABC transporter ATP-binding protein n=1 Tax=Schaalia sp. 19OD2882 TaxID=2794089 RepID=UPI0020A7638C|nr:ABC transporter ATP-binding protein [Schaalia sp. 19OD2882]